MRVKICGITRPDQGATIAALGANALGFICVQQSPRFVDAIQIQQIQQQLPPSIARIGVFMDTDVETIAQVVKIGGLTAVQLHGGESVEDCQAIRDRLPQIELIKALRIRRTWELEMAADYTPAVDWLLLDAYHPEMGGGTGKTLNWESLQSFKPDKPWFLAGGLRPDNIKQALKLIQPDGIDLSSGVEITPGEKDLVAVQSLFAHINGA
ncbi:phosphoribosylanthranilate isomerase [filamentous cyanobacterium LEGE 11480]|uniref:N-(5'-phosphoribosyl)anthranilate isomerase n=1 Tax=Romeriopsis navalis LEGE 11480 TaxID=2777977 RepID=A0A928VQM7_9CYAN|nr:phosphoribosylanthranilate isomerase [Romeriopsis navalis LEGE 11480]